MSWSQGQHVLLRAIAYGRAWLLIPVIVIEDPPGGPVAVYRPAGSPLGRLPGPTTLHPPLRQATARDPGRLMLLREREPYAIWRDDEIRLDRGARWRVRLQEPCFRTKMGFDISDHELDVEPLPVGGWAVTHPERLEGAVRGGRMSLEQSVAIAAQGEDMARSLNAGWRLWDPRWVSWTPDRAVGAPALPAGWQASESTLRLERGIGSPHAPPARCWVYDAAEVRQSPIEGSGLFAREPIPMGTTVMRPGGRLATNSELATLIRESDRYVDTIAIDPNLNLVLGGSELAHYGNHSCDPNLWHLGPFTLAARRDIEADEELTVDYATHSGGDWTMECRCGSPLCRGRVTGLDWRRADLQARYGAHWAPMLATMIGRVRSG